MNNHKAKVHTIRSEMKRFFSEGKKVKIYHGSTNSTRKQEFKRDQIIDISNLNNILRINQKGKYALVEPNVPMDKLVSETLKYGLIPPVVMEFPGITVGGGIQGGAGESSSFKYGLFDRTFEEYEVVLGNGEIIVASPKKNSDLFYGIVGSYGSLGIITLAKLKLTPAKKFVTLTYYKVKSFEEAIELIKSFSKRRVDFIDGIMFSKNVGTIMVGIFSDKKEYRTASFSKAWDEWFYLHAEKITKKHSEYTESIPIKEYLFRYNRGVFWTGRHGFEVTGVSFKRLNRFLFNFFFKTRTMYRFLQAVNEAQDYFAQDVFVPQENTLDILKYSHNKIKIYPVWFLPVKVSKREKLSSAYLNTKLAIDIGIWGEGIKNTKRFIQQNKDLEDFVKRLGGRKMLYAHSYYSKEKFWKIYDDSWYKNLREKYKAQVTLGDLYEKTRSSITTKVRRRKAFLGILQSPKKLPVS